MKTRNCCESVFNNGNKENNFHRSDFQNIWRTSLQNYILHFEGKYYKTIDRIAMGSLVFTSLANAFVCFYEQRLLNICPEEFKAVYYKKYVDDVFVLFYLSDHLENYLNHSYLQVI